MDVAALKARLSDVPGIETLTETAIGGRLVYGFSGLVAAVDPSSSEDQVVAAIRNAATLRAAPMPPVQPQPKGPAMSAPAPGGFAAQIRGMLNSARADLEAVKQDGLKQVAAAVGEMREAQSQVQNVTAGMAKVIRDETADVLAELGQISNMPPEGE